MLSSTMSGQTIPLFTCSYIIGVVPSGSSNCSKLNVFFKGNNSHTSGPRRQTCVELSIQAEQQDTFVKKDNDPFLLIKQHYG